MKRIRLEWLGAISILLNLASIAPQGFAAEVAQTVAPSARTVSMDFEDAELKLVLKVLSQQAGMNFVASGDAEAKKVTVFLSNVSVNDAIDAIMRANGLRYEMKASSNIFMVYSSDEQGPLQTRVFTLKYLRLSISSIDVGGQSVSRELLTKEDIAALAGGGSGGSAGANPGAAAEDKKDSGKEDKLTAERGIDKLVASLLSDKGKIAVDVNSNSLVVTDLPDKLAIVEAVLNRLDTPPKQVMLEAQLLETNAGLLDNKGLDWGGTDGALARIAGPARDTHFPFMGERLHSPFRAKSAQDSTLGSLFTYGTVDFQNFAATLRFITSQTDTKILAKPRVLTMNNEAAIIKLVTNTAIAQTSTITAAQSIATLTTGEAQRQETGIVLKMTPQVNTDDSITLFLEPSVTTVATSSFFPDSFLDPTTRTVRTSVRVLPGETLVIGGLVDISNVGTDKKVPILGDVPVMGRLFKLKSKDNSERELVIFITPTLVRRFENDWRREQSPVAVREREIEQALQAVSDRQVPAGPASVGE